MKHDGRGRFEDGGVGHDGGFSPRGMAVAAHAPDGSGGDGTYHITSGKDDEGEELVEVQRWRKNLDYEPQTSFTGGRLRTWTGGFASGLDFGCGGTLTTTAAVPPS